jgi:hypothetical protein
MRDTEVGVQRERWLAAAMTAAGGAVIGLALIQRWNPQEMSPGVEGALIAGFFGPMLALLDGLRFSRTLALAVPVWIIQLVACAAVSGPVVAVVGLEMVALGGFGLLLAQAKPRRRAEAQRGRGISTFAPEAKKMTSRHSAESGYDVHARGLPGWVSGDSQTIEEPRVFPSGLRVDRHSRAVIQRTLASSMRVGNL